jgi:hypothetical protein
MCSFKNLIEICSLKLVNFLCSNLCICFIACSRFASPCNRVISFKTSLQCWETSVRYPTITLDADFRVRCYKVYDNVFD